MARVYQQQVWATMHRVTTEEPEQYVFVRKETEVYFGSNSDHIIGAVCMSNPGSYAPRECIGRDWNAFCRGEGESEIRGWGYPDLTMQNVIQALMDASQEAGVVLDGKLMVYNLSSIVQPKGEDAEEYHRRAERVLRQEAREGLLTEPWMGNQSDFLQHCCSDRYPVHLFGFAESLFRDKRSEVEKWAAELPNAFYAIDDRGRWSHPRRWRTAPSLGGQIREKLTRYYASSTYSGGEK